MADEKEKAEENTEAAEKSGPGTLLIVGLVLAILFGLAGFGTAAFVILTKEPVEEPVTVGTVATDAAQGEDDQLFAVTEEDELDEGEAAIGAIYPLESFIVNLTGGRYLRAQIRLEFEGREVPRRFFPRIVPVRDLIIKVLSAKRAEDVLASQGREALKVEIKDRVNELLRREDVKNVYFSQFVVQ
jgi:flagellar FliL protein